MVTRSAPEQAEIDAAIAAYREAREFYHQARRILRDLLDSEDRVHANEPRRCLDCGRLFEPVNVRAVYCSAACKKRAWERAGRRKKGDCT